MNEKVKLCLSIIMIVVGSLVALDNAWEEREIALIEYMSTKECLHTFEDLNPAVFDVYKDGEYVSVNISGTDVKVYSSLSSSKAIQWAIDNIPNHTRIDILEDIIMDGNLDWLGTKKSYAMFAKGGYLVFTDKYEYPKISVDGENITGPWCSHHDPYREYFANEHIVGIIAYDSIFTNCTIDNSTLYHCEIIESNVTNTFIYASLFEYKYGVRYVDCSDGRKSYNITSWWKNP